MTNDSTIFSLKFGSKGKEMKSPRAASINFVKQFARVYSSLDGVNCSNLILN